MPRKCNTRKTADSIGEAKIDKIKNEEEEKQKKKEESQLVWSQSILVCLYNRIKYPFGGVTSLFTEFVFIRLTLNQFSPETLPASHYKICTQRKNLAKSF